ncbi:MAG: ImmA/IrrE family metallo-endopeptidase [Lachnospiraceae bacterium]|nr:ImmA/IrrE family metallo-endopeptidase [Lachnospiraceae bacterium]
MRNIFQTMDDLIETTGTSDPTELLYALGVKRIEPLYSSVIAYVSRYKNSMVVGVNVKMPETDQLFSLMHECEHVADHIPSGAMEANHQETAFFTMDKNIAVEEREANLCAAEYLIPTKDVLELTGYNCSTVREYRELKQEIESLARSYQPSARALKQKCSELEELEIEMSECQCIHTKKQIARILGYRTAYIAYKIEALRIRGYDIPELELPDSQHVFGLR